MSYQQSHSGILPSEWNSTNATRHHENHRSTSSRRWSGVWAKVDMDALAKRTLSTPLYRHGDVGVVDLFSQSNAPSSSFSSGSEVESMASASSLPLIGDSAASSGGDGGTRTLTAFRLALIGYFLTCAGPFGMEELVRSCGPLITFISLIVFPLVWCLPQALMSAELSLMMQENGGALLWVQQAFGDFLGWINGYNLMGFTLCQIATMVVLFVDYMPYEFQPYQAWLLRIGFVALLVVTNVVGLGLVSKLSMIFMFLIVSPFVIEVAEVIALGYADHPKVLLEVPPWKHVQLGVFLSTLAFGFGGFDTLGQLAGEVKGGRRSFFIGIFGVLPINMLNYMAPIAAGYLIDPHYVNWKSGYFTHLAYQISTWMGILVVMSSAITNFGVVNQVAGLARVMWAMAKPKHQEKKLPTFIYSLSFTKHDGTLVPLAAILCVGLLLILLSALPFTILVEMLLILRMVNLNLEYLALISLRYRAKDADRPFRIPGGNWVVWMLPIPTVAICITELALGSWQVLVAGVAFNILVVVLFVCFRIGRKVRHKLQSVRRERLKAQDQEEKNNLHDDPMIN